MPKKGMGFIEEIGIIILTIVVIALFVIGIVLPYLSGEDAGPKTPYDDKINKAAARYGVETILIKAMMKTGSDFDPSLTGDKIGLMAITEDMIVDVRRGQSSQHCKRLVTDDSQEPEQNINTGTCYFSYLLDRYDNNKLHALVAYHWKPELFDGVDKDIERASSGSRNYAKNVMGFYDEYKESTGWDYI